MHAIDREPLITGAIGFAIGAVVGAMLPNTRYENRAFGRARDRMMEGAGDAFEQVKDRAGHVVEESYAAARDSAEREGLMPDEGDRPLAERLGNVAKAAAAGTAAQAEREAGEERRPMAGNSGASFGSSAAGSTGGEAATNGIGRTVGTGGAGVDQPRTGADDLSAPGAVPKRDLGSGGSGAS